MTITNYTTLVASIGGADGWAHRDDAAFTAKIPEFIQFAESDMQVRCKLIEFEATATIPITAGVGTLPTDLVSMRSVYWDGNSWGTLNYVTPDLYDSRRDGYGNYGYYTIKSGSILTDVNSGGSLILTYNARFTPLSVSNPTNSLLTNFPDVYTFGACYQAALWAEDDPLAQKFQGLFDSAVGRVVINNQDRKYAGSTLSVRAR